MEITPTSKVPVKMVFNWARVRAEQSNDQSPLVKAILNDSFFTTCGEDEPGESSLFHIVANFWLISQMSPKDAKIPQVQHIPQQYLRFLTCVSNGQPYTDESLMVLLRRIGIPFLNMHGEPHYHYFPLDPDDNDGSGGSDWRGLPHLFTMLCDIDPLKANLTKHRANYITQPFFINFLRIQSFLYWCAQAYTQSIQLTTAIPIKDSLEVDGFKAFSLLAENTIKGYKEKDLSQALYDLVLVLCQVLAHGATLGTQQRSPFVNRVFQIIGDHKHIMLTDVTEFLLCGDFGSAFDAHELGKQTKGMAKRFHQSPWLPATVFPVDHIVSSEKGVAIFKDEFLKKLEAFEQLHGFLTTPPSGADCSIM